MCLDLPSEHKEFKSHSSMWVDAIITCSKLQFVFLTLTEVLFIYIPFVEELFRIPKSFSLRNKYIIHIFFFLVIFMKITMKLFFEKKSTLS